MENKKAETPNEVVVDHPLWGRIVYIAGCATCEGYKERGEGFFPRHDSKNAGHGAHCSCGRCF